MMAKMTEMLTKCASNRRRGRAVSPTGLAALSHVGQTILVSGTEVRRRYDCLYVLYVAAFGTSHDR